MCNAVERLKDDGFEVSHAHLLFLLRGSSVRNEEGGRFDTIISLKMCLEIYFRKFYGYASR